jgi:hypothetical protein
MRDAVKTDRRTSRDGSAVFAAAANATKKKQGPFSLVAARWENLLPRWAESVYEAPMAGVAEIAGLEVSVSPRFVEVWPTGLRERTFVYFNATKLSEPTLDLALRLVQTSYPSANGTVSVLLDVQRGNVHTELSRPTEVIDHHLSRLADEFLSNWAA